MANEQQFSKLSVSLLFDTSEFEYELKNVQKLLRTSGRAMQNIGRDMTFGISVPLGIATKAIVDTATEFEYQMARVQAISGASSRSFGMLQKNAEDLGASTIFTATSVGELQEEFAKLGFVSSEIVAVTESTLSLAQVTGADLGRAAEIAGSTLRTFGMEAHEVGTVNDIVATAISKSALDFESFAETMKYAGSEAAINGISIQELGAAMGVLANRGVKGSIAGTRLRMIFSKLAKEGGNVHEKFIDLINGNVTMTEAIARFGVRAAAAVPVLQENRDEFFALETAMLQSAGTLSAMQEIMDDTSFSVQRRLISALENLAIQFGKVVLPVFDLFLEVTIAVVNGISMMPMPMKAAIVAVGGFIAVLGPAIYLMGTFRVRMVEITQLAPKMGKAIAFAFGPYGLAIAAVTGLIAGLVSLSMKQEKFVSLSNKMADAQSTAAEASGKVLAPIRRLIGEYENVNTPLERRAEILSELKRAQPDYFGDLSDEATSVETLKGAYEKLSEAIINNAKAKAFAGKIKEVETESAKLIGAQVDAEIELEDIKRRRAAGEEGFADTTVFVPNKFVGGEFVPFDPTADRRKELNKIIADNQGMLDALDNQLAIFIAKAKEYGLTYNDIFGKPGAGGGGGAGDGTTKQADAMAQLAKDMSLVNEQVRLLNISPEEQAEGRFRAYQRALRGLINAAAEGEDVEDNLQRVADGVTAHGNALRNIKSDIETQKELNKVMTATNTVVDRVTNTLAKISESDSITELQLNLRQLQRDYNKLGERVRILDELGMNSQWANAAREAYATLGAEIDATSAKIEKLTAVQNALVNGIYDAAAAGVAAAASQERVGRAMINTIAETSSALIRQLYIEAAVKSIQEKGFTLGLLGLGVGAGVLSGFLNSIPKLAEGGIAMGSQLAVVGDNRSGREAIIPLEKLPGLMQKMGGGGTGRLYGTIEGYDLVLTNERNNRFLQRHSR